MARNFVAASNQYILIGDISALDFTSSFSVSCFFKLSDTTAERKILGKWEDTGSLFQYLLTVAGAGNNILQAHIYDGGFNRADATTTVSSGIWYHAVETYETNSLKVWLNGVNEGTDTSVGNPTNQTSPFKIGAGGDASTHRNPFNGDICEVAGWNRVLSSAEITSLSQGYSPSFFPNGLVFYMPLTGANNPEYEMIGKTEYAPTGATKIAHPDKIRYPNGFGNNKHSVSVGNGMSVSGEAL